MITREEDNLLQTLRMRYMDGKVGNQIKLPSGALMWYEICNGVPIKYIVSVDAFLLNLPNLPIGESADY